MNGYDLTLAGARLTALPSGALWWQAERCLAIADLHLGRAERYARRAGALLPPYEVEDTLARLDADIAATGPALVICLGDSFDDMGALELGEDHALWLARLMAGRRWVWIAGNHDPGPFALGGAHLAALALGPVIFRHIAEPGAAGEISGHYHPKLRLGGRTHRCFLADSRRLILPAYGTYTGGLGGGDPALRALMGKEALAILTGVPARPVPFGRAIGLC